MKIFQKTIMIAAVAVLCFSIAACTRRYTPMLSSHDGVNFKTISLAQAEEIAKAENKPLFVFAHASWCPTCNKMEQEVLVQKKLGDVYNQQFIDVAIDIDSPEGHKLNDRYKIRATPTLFFLNADGSIAKKTEGFMTAEELVATADGLKIK